MRYETIPYQTVNLVGLFERLIERQRSEEKNRLDCAELSSPFYYPQKEEIPTIFEIWNPRRSLSFVTGCERPSGVNDHSLTHLASTTSHICDVDVGMRIWASSE